ncbi:MAG: LysR family transcriptional regulator [Alphaproteobacteria bacterium]|nr:LysR family transcriptional regulator [Alphaproteobacteria bacterium]
MDEALRWDDLRTLLAVARRGTLAAASADLGVDASTVHRRLAALEQALGTRLFDRDPRGYRLTAVGESLLPRAVEVEEGVLALRRAATGHDGTARGPVRVSLPPTLVPLMGAVLARIASGCPGLEPRLLATPAFVDLRREAEVVLRVAEQPPDEAIAHRIGPVAWAAYASGGGDAPWIHYVGLDHVAAVARFAKLHPDERVLARVDEVGAARDLLRGLPARALLPCYLGDVEPALQRLGDPWPDPPTLWVLVHTDLRRSARVRALLDHTLPALRELAPLLAGTRPAQERTHGGRR